MENSLTPQNMNLEATKQELQKFALQVLNAEPKPQEIKSNKFANNSKYLPIGVIERKLDEMFIAWQTENFRYQVIGNELTGVITLKVLHPMLLTWISYEGAGAVQIQFTKGSDFTNFANKIQNTLQKDFPHLKSECLKNAAKHLGKAFGRDLNRDETGDYAPVNNSELIDNDIFSEIKVKVKRIKNTADLKEYFDIIEPEYKTTEIINLFTAQKAKITKK